MNSAVPLLSRAWHWLTTSRDPVGYQPGQMLKLVARDFRPYPCERLSQRCLSISLPQGMTVEVHEKATALFRSFVVCSHFYIQGVTGLQHPVRMKVRNGNVLGQGGIRFRCKAKNDDSQRLLAVLNCYPQIFTALEQLHFRQLNLWVEQGRWRLEIEHFAASEVISQVPVERRYQKLHHDQRQQLLNVMQMFEQLMTRVAIEGVAA